MQDKHIPHASAEQVSLKDILLTLRRYYHYLINCWKTIIIAVVAGALTGLIYAYCRPVIYKAELTFVLDDDASSRNANPYGALASQFGLNLIGGSSGGGIFVGENLTGLMQSRFMIEKTFLTPVSINGKSQTLADLFLKAHSKSTDSLVINFPVGLERTKFSRQQDSLLGSVYKNFLENNLTVGKRDKNSGLLSVVVKSQSEIFSKLFAELLVKEVSSFYVETKTKRSAKNLEILQFQTDSVRRELNAAMSGVASSIDANPNPNPALQTLKLPSQRKQVDAQTNQAMFIELIKNLEAAKVTLRKETPLFQIVDTPILPLEKEGFGKLKGLVIGGFLAGFLIVAFLLIKKMFKDIVNG